MRNPQYQGRTSDLGPFAKDVKRLLLRAGPLNRAAIARRTKFSAEQVELALGELSREGQAFEQADGRWTRFAKPPGA